MNAARRGRIVAFAAAALTAAAALASPAHAAVEASPGAPLQVRTSSISWSAHRLTLTIEQDGVLKGKRLAVFVFIDGNMVGRIDTTGSVTEASLGELEIAAGDHELLAKSGTMEATTRFRRLSLHYSAGALALVAVGLSAWLLRRRSR